MLRSHLTNVTVKVILSKNSCCEITLSHCYMATSEKRLEKSSVLSRRLKVELDDRTSGDRVFQTRAVAIGKARSPTVDRFDIGTANMFHDHERNLIV